MRLALIFPLAVSFAATDLNISPTNKFQFANTSTTTNSTLLDMRPDFNTSSDGVLKLNETATGIACLSASSSWWEGSRSYRSLHPYSIVTIRSTTVDYRLSASTYKYCDDVPRVSGTEAIVVSFILTLPPAQWETIRQLDTFQVYPIPPPPCSVDPLDCKYASESWKNKLGPWTSIDLIKREEYYRPNCSTTSTRPPDTSCFIDADGAHLIYWPSTLVQSSTYSCENGTILKEIIAPRDTELVTAVINSTTYTSPTLYISFKSIWKATYNTFPWSGTTKYNLVIAMDSRSLLSQRITTPPGLGPLSVKYPFNFLDLTGPVPLAAYCNQARCDSYLHDNHQCRTIFDDYYPDIIGPQELKNADPIFASCNIIPFSMKDPPIALSRQDILLDPGAITPTGKPTSEPASPSKNSQLDQAPKTADPTTQGDPSAQSSSQASLQPADPSHSDLTGRSQMSITPSRTSGSPTSKSEKSDPKSSSALEISAQQDLSSSGGSQQDLSDNPMALQTSSGSESGSPSSIKNPQGPLSRAGSQHGSINNSATQNSAGGSQRGSKSHEGELLNEDPEHDISTWGGQEIPNSNSAIITISTVPVSQAPGKPAYLLAGSETISADRSAVTIDNTPVSLGDNRLILGGKIKSTYMISTHMEQHTVAWQVFSPGSSWVDALAIDSSLSVYESAAKIKGEVFSVAPFGLVISDITFPLNSVPTMVQQEVVATAGSQLITFIKSEDGVVIGDTTLSADEQGKILNGQVISVAQSGIILDGSTITLPASATFMPQVDGVFTLGGQRYTAGSGSVGHGLPATVSAEVVSLSSSGILIVEQNLTSSQDSERPTPSPGIGAMIMSAFGRIGEGASTRKATETSQALGPPGTNLQGPGRLTSSAGMGVLIISAFGRIGEEASTRKATETSPILDPLGATTSSAQVTSGSSATISNQTIAATGALATTNKHSGATGRREVRWWMLFLVWLGAVFVQ